MCVHVWVGVPLQDLGNGTSYCQGKELLLAICTNCLMSSLLEHKVLNVLFVVLYYVQNHAYQETPSSRHLRLQSALWYTSYAYLGTESRITMLLLPSERGLAVELHKLLAEFLA